MFGLKAIRLLPTKRAIQVMSRRSLNVHEHVAMDVLRSGGVAVPNFGVAKTAQQAVDVARKLSSSDFVVKAQVLAGGRGRGKFSSGLKGGVKLVYSTEEVHETARLMLGTSSITNSSYFISKSSPNFHII